MNLLLGLSALLYSTGSAAPTVAPSCVIGAAWERELASGASEGPMATAGAREGAMMAEAIEGPLEATSVTGCDHG